MTDLKKLERDERLAETFEPKPTHVPEPVSHPLMGVPCSTTGAWAFYTNHEIRTEDEGQDHVHYFAPAWIPADFTTPYWFHRLIVMHGLTLHGPTIMSNQWMARTADGFTYASNADPAIAVAECTLKIREMGKRASGEKG